MRATSNRNAWVWVAIAAIALAALSPAEARLLGAKVRANLVLERLIKSQGLSPAAAGVAPHRFAGNADRFGNSSSSRSVVGLWGAVLPVLFVGLLAPLALLSAAFFDSFGRNPAWPALAAAYQRPPPQLV